LFENIHDVTTENVRQGRVFWVTGLSGAGKTTLSRALTNYLRDFGRPVILLDGDELREVMGASDSYTREDRLMLARRYARFCQLLAKQRFDVVIATISLFREIHSWNRENIPEYIEIFLNVPLYELARRDPKAIYQRVSKNEIQNVAGLDFIIDYPEIPDVVIEWDPNLTVEKALKQIIEYLKWRRNRYGN